MLECLLGMTQPCSTVADRDGNIFAISLSCLPYPRGVQLLASWGGSMLNHLERAESVLMTERSIEITKKK
jgi:hypothetical protein